jgi:TatD DNase family protein
MGLDYHRDFSPRHKQLDVFEQQLSWAIDCQKPVFLHEREAHDDFFALLKNHRDSLKNAVVHCFTGDKKTLFKYLDLDCYIGITGWICDERRGQEVLDLVHQIPLNRLMIETDAPYLLPRNLPKETIFQEIKKRHRNEPFLLDHVAKTVAQCYTLTEAEVKNSLLQNSLYFFEIVY